MDRRNFFSATTQIGSGLLMASMLGTTAVMAQNRGVSTAEAVGHFPHKTAGKSSVFITGSSDGLGFGAAKALLTQGHQVVVHVRSQSRMTAVEELVKLGAVPTVGDLSDLAQVRDLASQVNAIGDMDAVIHNAGVMTGSHILTVNVVAPYMLTALIKRPKRLIYLSSRMHTGGRPQLQGQDWLGASTSGSYADSKLFVTTLANAIARKWPDVHSNSVNPGWVPTKMGGRGAPGDLRLGHLTQEWLATSNDAAALTSGGYWYHQRREEPHVATRDVTFQDQLLIELARVTGVALT